MQYTGKIRDTFKLFVEKTCKKLSMWKFSHRCEDNIRIDFNSRFLFYNRLVNHNTSLQRAFVNTVMNV